MGLGDCGKSRKEVANILRKMLPEWMGPSYSLLHKNCCSFSNVFAVELGVGEIPTWVHRLADAGASLDDGVHEAIKEIHHVEHIVHEDANKLLEKLHVFDHTPRNDKDPHQNEFHNSKAIRSASQTNMEAED